MPELKPCPFCGSTNLYYRFDVAWVHCEECNADGPCATDDADAVDLWNSRAEVKRDAGNQV